MDLIWYQAVHRSTHMLVYASRARVVFKNRSKKTHKLVGLELRAHDVFGPSSLHETHWNQVRLTNEFHVIGSILGGKVMFRRKSHELTIRFLRQWSSHWRKTFE